MELDTYIKIGLPVSLGLIMLSMGLTLRTLDFKRIADAPRAFLIGLSMQMLLPPLLAIVLLQLFQIPPVLAVGLLALSFSPGGATSNLFSYLARGDVALSITLTAVASFITPFTIPVLMELSLQTLMSENRDIIIPIGLTMKRLLIVTILPVLIGMMLRAFKPFWAERIQPLVHRFSMLLFLTVIVSIIINQWDNMPQFLNQVGLITTLMIILAMLLSFLLASWSKLNKQQIKTISIEVGMQNGGMALIVTQSVLNNSTMSIVPVVYGLIMLVPVILFVITTRQRETATAI